MAMTFPPNRQASFLPPLPASSLAMPVAGQQQAAPNYVPARSNPPNPDYFSNIIGAYQNKQATQKQQGGFVQDILSKRFTPTRDDRMTAYNRSTDALYAPNVFKAATPEDVASERAALELTPYSLMAKNAGSTPSAVQEYQYYNTLTPDEQRRYLEVKRNPQFLNLGDRFLAPGSGQAYAKGLPPDEAPGLKGQQAEATARGKVIGESAGNTARKEAKAPEIDDLLNRAEQLLPNATSGGLATRMRDAVAYGGIATKGSQIDTQLDVIGAALVQNVPRMEGPQSNYDVALYQQAAGDLANSNKPIEARLSALQIMRQLNRKYSGQGMAAPAPQAGGGYEEGDILQDENGNTFVYQNGKLEVQR